MIHVIKNTVFDRFISGLIEEREAFVLSRSLDNSVFHLVKTPSWDPAVHTIGAYRPVEPLKSLFFPPRASVGALFDGRQGSPLPERIVVGVKNCDLSSLRIHDYIFLSNEPVDPYYKEAREKTLVVTADCSASCDVCFCTAVGEQPFPKQDFDLNISPLANGYLIETGSPRGEKAVEPLKNMVEPADGTLIKQRDARREEVAVRVAEQAARKGLKPELDYEKAIRASEEKSLWNEFSKKCVECGACNFACCTCHCFLLADGMDDRKQPSRLKQWDSCLYLNFARVAGGANPRRHRAERLYNRFNKKFVFFPTVLKKYACDGCGRCIEACTGKIDIREVLKKALDETESV
jgi:sulfhydrogenase subunit beta (sulfur reductase)